MRTGSLGRVRSTTISAVMILVRLAIGSRCSALRRHSTSPVLTSISSAARGCLRKCSRKASTPSRRTAGGAGGTGVWGVWETSAELPPGPPEATGTERLWSRSSRT